MENVGQSKSRNKEFQKKFSRDRLLKHIVNTDAPIVLDVGAHHGESVMYLKSVFPEALIYSFEPDPDSFRVLSLTAIEKVLYFNLALSDADGTASFYRNHISHTNSLLKVNINSKDSISIGNAIAENDLNYFSSFNQEVNVAVMKLDSFSKKHLIDRVDLLKIDVQGAESRVLCGAVETLQKTRVVVLEVNFFDYYECQTSFMDIEKILLPLGFKMFSISEISNNPMNGRTDWAEVVYINNEVIKG